MIRINLLRERKAARSLSADKGERVFVVGAGIVLACAALTYFVVHRPLTGELDQVQQDNGRRKKTVDKLKEETADFDSAKDKLKVAQSQEEAISKLGESRATPAWVLSELSQILTKDNKPTMSTQMELTIRRDVNRQFSPGWDPQRVWLTSFSEKDGAFTMTGGALSSADVNQLALRLQASVYFPDAAEVGTSTVVDGQSKQSYYQFTIQGRVLY